MNQARGDCTAHVQPPASPLGFALVFTDVELVWWSPSRLMSGCFLCLHKHKRPSLTYHPTCNRRFLRGVRQPLDWYRFGKSLSDFPEIDLSPWTWIEEGPEQRPERCTYLRLTSAEQNLTFQERRSRTGAGCLVKVLCFFSASILSKGLGYSPWFWRWQILVSAGNRSKLPETPPICLQMDF